MNIPSHNLGTDPNRPEQPITLVSANSQDAPAILARNNFDRIPAEMRPYRQWLVWRLVLRAGDAKPTKLPFNVHTGQLASVTNPSDWCSFDEAVAASHNYSGIGFVLTKADRYTFLDLDDTKGDEVAHARQLRIFQQLNSYSEKSPSGAGLHIIVKASIPSGKRRGNVEIYDNERYMTMTGDVYGEAAIEERQELAATLWAEMGGSTGSLIDIPDKPEQDSDSIILNRAAKAANGDKFRALNTGNWQGNYASQSEADQALVNILAFYTKNRVQIARLFRQSGLGKREKASRHDYMATMIAKSLDREIAHVEGVAEFTAAFAAKFRANPVQATNVFSFVDFTKDSRPPSYIWHRVFQRNYLYTITGMWGAGKSALAITVAVHAALGLTLCDHQMVAAKVLILCGENPDDVRLRVRAACAAFEIEPETLEGQLFFTKLPFAIDNQTARDAFIADAVRVGEIDLLIIDTGPAHSSADDENDNRQSHELAIAIRLLMEALGGPATIALMHPTKGANRDTVGTSRGGGAFSGSVDALCGVWRHENGAMEFFHCNKFRGPGFDPMFFDLTRHEFADMKDNFGEAAISVVAVPTNTKPKASTRINTANRIALDALGSCRHMAIPTPIEVSEGLPKCDGTPLFSPFVVVPEALWRDGCYKMGISGGEQSAKAAAFRRSRNQLIDLRLIHTYADHYWLPEWCGPATVNEASLLF